MKTEIQFVTEESIRAAGDVLQNGGIVAFPTDTVYGLGAVCTDEEAVKKIFAAKGRDEGKPLSILVGSMEHAERLAQNIPEKAYALMRSFWPGPLTIVLQKRPEVSLLVSAGDRKSVV